MPPPLNRAGRESTACTSRAPKDLASSPEMQFTYYQGILTLPFQHRLYQWWFCFFLDVFFYIFAASYLCFISGSVQKQAKDQKPESPGRAQCMSLLFSMLHLTGTQNDNCFRDDSWERNGVARRKQNQTVISHILHCNASTSISTSHLF